MKPFTLVGGAGVSERLWLLLLLLLLFFVDFVSGCGVIDVRGAFKHTTASGDAVIVVDVVVVVFT